jgi:hypothetical protein
MTDRRRDAGAMFRRCAGLTVAAMLALAAPGGAAVVTYKNVVSPSKLIGCIALKYGGPGIECTAPYLPGKHELDPYFALKAHGTVKTGERGDYPGYPGAKQHTLHYGDTWKRPGIRCTMQSSGLTCHNLDQHGFHIARGDVRRF